VPSTIGIVASGAIGFDPSKLTDIVGWWDASDASTFTYGSGTAVSQWNSKVGSYAFVQATALKQPSRSATINGLSAVLFDGSNDSMATSATVDMNTARQTWSLFWVATVAASTFQMVLEQSADFNTNGGAFNSSRGTGNSPEVARQNAGAYSAIVSSQALTTTPKSVIGTCNAALSTNEVNIWVNGVGGGTRPINQNTFGNNRNLTMFLGARNNASFFLNGTVCEFGFTTAVMTADEITNLTSYLAGKWGL
jgi:hypothetical protein